MNRSKLENEPQNLRDRPDPKHHPNLDSYAGRLAGHRAVVRELAWITQHF
jgi:hypothetical protein